MIIKAETLEKLAACKFHLGNRILALELHKKGQLNPSDLDIAIWTDGSLNREQLLPDADPICGAAAIILVTDPKNTINERLEDSTQRK